MMKNIKSMYNQMLDEVKKEAVTALSKEFNRKEVVVKQNWIYPEKIPKEYQEKVVGIFQRLLKSQYEATGELLEEF